MSTTTATDPTAPVAFVPSPEALGSVLTLEARPPRPSALSASITFCWRAMLKIKHVPEQLVDVTAFPVIMTLLFTFLFGGAIGGSTGAYLQYLLPGIMVTSVLMITMYTGVGVSADIAKGSFDRFRTLPIWRPASMVGMLLADAVRYVVAAAVVMILGTILGFRPAGGVLGVLGGLGLLVIFSFAVSWFFTMFGFILRDSKSVLGLNFVMFPLTFLSNVFVDPITMPGWLQAFVKVNPVTHLVGAVRSTMAGTPDGGEITWVLLSSVAFVVVFGALTMRLYNRK
jgi:ABC-2 type transport system permease protein